MDIMQIVGWILAIVGVGAAVYFRLTGQDKNGEFFNTLFAAQSAAREAVAAAEQLWQSGQIEKDARFDFVFAQLKKLFPTLNGDTLEMTIEAAVYWLKQAAANVPGSVMITPAVDG